METDGQENAPELVLGSGDIIGNLLGRALPFNLQNLLGNWLMLVGQALITFNAQQQYLEYGPGRYYDLRNKNIDAQAMSNVNTEVQPSTTSRNQNDWQTIEDRLEKMAYQLHVIEERLNRKG